MGRTESLNLKNDYERACGWYGHFNKSEMALFSECTDRYAQNMLDTADIVREAIFLFPTNHSRYLAAPRRERSLRIHAIWPAGLRLADGPFGKDHFTDLDLCRAAVIVQHKR